MLRPYIYSRALLKTGTGKTFSMDGTAAQHGIIPRAIDHIFESLTAINIDQPDAAFLVRVSYLEVYNERIRDLFAAGGQDNLQINEDTQRKLFFVKDLTE